MTLLLALSNLPSILDVSWDLPLRSTPTTRYHIILLFENGVFRTLLPFHHKYHFAPTVMVSTSQRTSFHMTAVPPTCPLANAKQDFILKVLPVDFTIPFTPTIGLLVASLTNVCPLYPVSEFWHTVFSRKSHHCAIFFPFLNNV